MLIDSWLLQHAVELADQAGLHIAAAADAVGHEARMLFEEVTGQSGACSAANVTASVNAGCCENLPG
jgi:hypothetical protein